MGKGLGVILFFLGGLVSAFVILSDRGAFLSVFGLDDRLLLISGIIMGVIGLLMIMFSRPKFPYR